MLDEKTAKAVVYRGKWKLVVLWLVVAVLGPSTIVSSRIVGENHAGSNVLYTETDSQLSHALDHTTPLSAVGEIFSPPTALEGGTAAAASAINGSVLANLPVLLTDSATNASRTKGINSSTHETVNGMPSALKEASSVDEQVIGQVANSSISTSTVPSTTSTVSSTTTVASTSTTTTTTIATTPAHVGAQPVAPTTSTPPAVPAPMPVIECYYAPPELCAERRGDCECNIDPAVPGALYCCNVTDINKAIGCVASEMSNWKYLHIRNVTMRELALNVSNRYIKTLLSLSITDGAIQRISNSFARFSSPVCLNVSNNNISEIEQRAFRELRSLTMLDLSYNNLSTIPLTSGLQKFRLDIRGNVGMLCKSLLESLKGGVKFKDPESTFCLTNRTFNWFNSTDSLPLHQLEMIQRVQDECPEKCTCELDRLNFDLNNTERKTITTRVACTGLGLTKFPDRLPAGTVTLNISNNNITSLEALNHPPYQSLLRLHADDNQISSLSELEGMDFVSRFTLFSIRRNKLKTVQSYIFAKSLDLGSYIFLEGNPMSCDCNAAKGFKNWLLSRKAQVPDHEYIFCEGNTNLPQLVTIQESKLCQSQHDWTDYIYYLIATEVLLLIALVCKVSYDYWVFKSAGYLPWPANKMPKLPCDCLCE
ncbi:protein halfway [Anopheles ziemanni]|uniref:protein halfway n=1 Tax=Anopheles coustani TaxID=139045 RepID=UPI0026593F5F|nr:protein halfway [Anopheles coustani]XP_058176189.1 protein halfway [Anopheles ziemanni]